ncbi:dTDP-glucose 4,6-dehydratase [Nocardiopsis kunsanensis]|uniref:dTDP-glucose 4,6-dehydratase n=1 Tax=Nocardiopsis kunsanensis TaxID=141693 RepID=UPI000347C841|nr:dTDP-glucose 4,6-dehydratase [Nocardiopsis kunsanensis]
MRVLVTGGAGFIGSHYVRSALRGELPGLEDAEVTVLDNLTYAGLRENLAPVDGGFTLVVGSVADRALVSDVVPGHDLVVNFAAETHVDRSIAEPDSFVIANVLGTQTLMQACSDAGTPRIVQVSTDEVYGSAGSGSWDESASIAPNSPYAATKASGDLIALSYARTYGLPVSVTRCGNNYGSHQMPEKVIPLFVTNLLRGRPVPLYGDGSNVRQWVHVADHCRGIQTVVDEGEPGEVYHVSGGTELSNRELTAMLLSVCDADWDMVRHVADRPGHDFRYSLDDSRLRSLGYEERVPFAEGLADTVRWYRENRDWWEPLLARLAGTPDGRRATSRDQER